MSDRRCGVEQAQLVAPAGAFDSTLTAEQMRRSV
jgi:hypothetical protein